MLLKIRYKKGRIISNMEIYGVGTSYAESYGYFGHAVSYVSGSDAAYGSSGLSEETPGKTGDSSSSGEPKLSRNVRVTSSGEELTPEEQQEIARLQQRDREVRDHEAAHVAAGGIYVRGGATFTYQTGPDNKRYAVGGEVSIDTSPVRGNPEATIVKMQTVRRAALAPADPSGQDRAVAAAASGMEAAARQELRREQSEEFGEEGTPKKVSIGPKNQSSAAIRDNTFSSYDSKGSIETDFSIIHTGGIVDFSA